MITACQINSAKDLECSMVLGFILQILKNIVTGFLSDCNMLG